MPDLCSPGVYLSFFSLKALFIAFPFSSHRLLYSFRPIIAKGDSCDLSLPLLVSFSAIPYPVYCSMDLIPADVESHSNERLLFVSLLNIPYRNYIYNEVASL